MLYRWPSTCTRKLYKLWWLAHSPVLIINNSTNYHDARNDDTRNDDTINNNPMNNDTTNDHTRNNDDTMKLCNECWRNTTTQWCNKGWCNYQNDLCNYNQYQVSSQPFNNMPTSLAINDSYIIGIHTSINRKPVVLSFLCTIPHQSHNITMSYCLQWSFSICCTSPCILPNYSNDTTFNQPCINGDVPPEYLSHKHPFSNLGWQPSQHDGTSPWWWAGHQSSWGHFTWSNPKDSTNTIHSWLSWSNPKDSTNTHLY